MPSRGLQPHLDLLVSLPMSMSQTSQLTQRTCSRTDGSFKRSTGTSYSTTPRLHARQDKIRVQLNPTRALQPPLEGNCTFSAAACISVP